MSQGPEEEMIEQKSFVKIQGRPSLMEMVGGTVSDLQAICDVQARPLELLWDKDSGCPDLEQAGVPLRVPDAVRDGAP
jgi:hypothetical protein